MRGLAATTSSASDTGQRTRHRKTCSAARASPWGASSNSLCPILRLPTRRVDRLAAFQIDDAQYGTPTQALVPIGSSLAASNLDFGTIICLADGVMETSYCKSVSGQNRIGRCEVIEPDSSIA